MLKSNLDRTQYELAEARMQSEQQAVEEEDGGGKSNGMAWKIADSIEDGTINRKVLLDNEMRLLLGLKCDLVVHHPSKHVFNFVRMIGQKLRERKVIEFNSKQEKNLFDSCAQMIRKLYVTDAPLLYEPPELAIAVLRICSRESCATEGL